MSDRSEKAKMIFLEAIERHAPEQWPAFLDEACAGDPLIRAGVEKLLHAQVEIGSFHEEPRSPVLATIDEPQISERPGMLIGPYKLLEQIGEGGFGVVFMAEQTQPVRRKVALKILKPGMDTRQVVARFEAERQALAIMDHPNIARVFDGGATASGRPFFVMELVKGVPIAEHCDQNHLRPRERLELFVSVCQAVQHAHQKGIIHRDLKPSNVLVTMHDAMPLVKVIDFGVAKAMGQTLTDKTLLTGFAQMIGTPLYMSPEQAGQSNLDIDTRSDIYSLGVLLYELLTGSTPFDKERFKQAAYDEIRRIIREEEPPKPSTRLSSTEALPSIAANRGLEPTKLSGQVRGELDWIVMKALDKDRNRRYETANGFAMDVQRYLADEPVLACSPTAGYRLRKFARRNKTALAIASVIGVSILLAVWSLAWAVRDRVARHAKVAGQLELILQEADSLVQKQKWPEALAVARRAEAAVTVGEADAACVERVRELLKGLEFIDRLEQIRMQRATVVDAKFDNAGAVRAYGQAFSDYGVDVEELPVETSISQLRARPARAIPLAAALDDWVTARREVSESDTDGWMRLVAVARGIDREPLRDRLRSSWGRPSSETHDELRQLADSIDVRAQHPVTLLSLAIELSRTKQSDSALRLLRDAQYVYPGDFWLNFELGATLSDQQDYEGAIRFYTAAVSIRPNSATVRHNLGDVLGKQKKLPEAIANWSKAIELAPNFAAGSYSNRGVAYLELGQVDNGLADFSKTVELRPKFASAWSNRGAAYLKLGQVDKAVADFSKAVELDQKFASAWHNRGETYLDLGQLDKAIADISRAIELDPKHAPSWFIRAVAYRSLGHHNEAIADVSNAVELDPTQANFWYERGWLYSKIGKQDKAIADFSKVIELDPGYVSAWYARGRAYRMLDQPDKALPDYSKSIELNSTSAASWEARGWANHRLGQSEEALADFSRAIELDPKLADAWGWRGMLHRKLGQTEKALADYSKVIELDPTQVHAWMHRAQIHFLLGQWERGSNDCAQLLALTPQDAWTHNTLAWMLATCPDVKFRDANRALDLARRAVELKPNSYAYWHTLGVACYRAQKWHDALVALEESCKLDTATKGQGNAWQWLWLAMVQWQMGNKEDAGACYDKAVQHERVWPEELLRFEAEAAELLDVSTVRRPAPVRSKIDQKSTTKPEGK